MLISERDDIVQFFPFFKYKYIYLLYSETGIWNEYKKRRMEYIHKRKFCKMIISFCFLHEICIYAFCVYYLHTVWRYVEQQNSTKGGKIKF